MTRFNEGRQKIERELKAYRLGWMQTNPRREAELLEDLKAIDEAEARVKAAHVKLDREALAMLKRAVRLPRAKRMNAREAANESIRRFDAGDEAGAIRALREGK